VKKIFAWELRKKMPEGVFDKESLLIFTTKQKNIFSI
jgi:hypothetical protein